MKTHVMMPRIPSSRTVLVLLFLAATAFGLLGMNLRPAHALSLYSVNQTKSGLLGSDPLTAQLSQAQLATSSYWFFGGDAIAQNSPYAFSEDASGLHIGVQATPVAPFAGFYAVHKDNAMVAHAVLTSPSRTVPSGYPNVGLYVQTGGPDVNYAVCAATTSSAQTFWSVALAIGNPNTAFQYIPLYVDSSANQPLTRDCTIVTNGQNYLAVYFDGSQVYQSSTLNLGYQAPFQFFLETQTSYTGGMFYGTFQDFYLANSDSVTVTKMPSSSVAQIVSPFGQVLASAPADGSGRHEALDRGNPRHPGFHRTNSVDYAIVLSGEIVALMDEGEVVLKTGDVLIQRGTNHAWSNRTDQPACLAFVLIGAEPLDQNR